MFICSTSRERMLTQNPKVEMSLEDAHKFALYSRSHIYQFSFQL